MSSKTNKFGLLIVDDEKEWRKCYREHLLKHEKLKYVWDSIEERDNGESALEYIKQYIKTNEYKLFIVSDCYMKPNFDGNTEIEEGKLFGGLWLINEICKEVTLKKSVTVMLVSYFDEKIKEHIRGRKPNFKCMDGEDYYFCEKPYTFSDSGESEQKDGTEEFSNEFTHGSRDYKVDWFVKTIYY